MLARPASAVVTIGSLWRSVSAAISLTLPLVKPLGIAIRPAFGFCACAAMTESSSARSRTGAAMASMPRDVAAAWKGLR